MCTLTWFVKNDGYELFFNRDERKSRSHAQSPNIFQRNQVSYISPTDSDAGGTWIATNQFGVTVCLLNHYQFEQIESYKAWTSRGEMVRAYSDISDISRLDLEFMNIDLSDFRAFRMFLIDPTGRNRLCIWDGHKAKIEVDVLGPKSSSSVSAKEVKQDRKKLFKDLGLQLSKNREDYLKYHASHIPDKSQNSVCMHREDASTVSHSCIDVNETSVNFYYADGPPCEALLGSAVTILIDRHKFREMDTVDEVNQ